MDTIKNIKLRWLHGALHDITYELSRSQFSRFAPHAWEPAINAYRCESCIRICVDLAGVERSRIDLTVEPQRVVIRGSRDVPEPTHAEGRGAVAGDGDRLWAVRTRSAVASGGGNRRGAR